MEVGYAFDPVQHAHTYNGKRMFGVTSVLKAWGDKSQLVNWAANCAVDYIDRVVETVTKNGGDYHVIDWKSTFDVARTAHTKKRDRAGDNGTQVHAELEYALNDIIINSVDSSREIRPVVRNVLKWMSDDGIKPLKSEMPVYSLEHFYAGIADGVIEKDGKKYILDFKTSGYVYTTAFMQMGAYAHAIKEMKPGAEIAGAVVVHIPRGKSFNPEKNVYWFYDIEQLEQAFLNVLNTYKVDYELQKLIKY